MLLENYFDQQALERDPVANHGRPYRQCALSVLDTIADPNIEFDENGVSNYYHQYKKQEKEGVLTGKAGEEKLEQIVEAIRKSGKGQAYDCITGVSGGMDSTYLTLQAKKLGLSPLVVHFDNGWNSELAVKNIENIIGKLGFDLYTLVVDWNEFKDVQLAYLKASVVDIEAITDHAIIATLFKLALKHNIKYILSGTNIVTEAVLPTYWVWSKADHVNLLDIHKKYGSVRLKTFPLFNLSLKKKSQLSGIQSVAPLNFIPYNKEMAQKAIMEELDWRDYGGKHYESIFTKFYQGYILPYKFNIDKRKAHLSNLIFSGQLTKKEAQERLQAPIYPEGELEKDYHFVLKKFELSKEKFGEVLSQPRREHSDFKVEKSVWDSYKILRPFKALRQKLIK